MLEQKQGKFWNLLQILNKVIERYFQILVKNFFNEGQMSKNVHFRK